MKVGFNIFILVMLLSGCRPVPVQRFQGMALGTFYSVIYMGEEDRMLPRGVDSVLNDISSQFSIFDSLSFINAVNRGENVVVTPDFSRVFQISQEVSEMTGGAFDITIGPLVEYWGFGPGQKGEINPVVIDSLKNLVGYKKVTMENDRITRENKNISLNVNAVAKGFAVDKVSSFLEHRGYHDFVVDIGGEITAKGSKNGQPWKVGIQVPTEHKNDKAEASYVFDLKGKSVATSGDYRNYIEEDGIRYAHIIDPVTGYPERSTLLSVSVVADDCMTADALATALMVLGLEKSLEFLAEHTAYAAYFIYDDRGYRTYKTANFP